LNHDVAVTDSLDVQGMDTLGRAATAVAEWRSRFASTGPEGRPHPESDEEDEQENEKDEEAHARILVSKNPRRSCQAPAPCLNAAFPGSVEPQLDARAFAFRKIS